MLLSDCLSKFLDYHYIKGSSVNTIRYYDTHIGFFVSFVNDVSVSSVSYDMYCNYIMWLRSRYKYVGHPYAPKSLSSQKVRSATIRTYANAVKIFLSWCFKQGYISDDLSLKIILPKQQKSVPNIISSDKIKELLSSYNVNTILGARNVLILVLYFDCGLRLSELVGINVSDILFDENVIKVTGKGDKQRLVPMSDSVIFYIKNYLRILNNKSNGLLFLKFDGTPITKSSIRLLFRRIKKKFKFDRFYPHLLRHSYATLFLVNGGNALSLQEILGHTTLDMTKKYVHIANSINIAKQRSFSPLSS